MNRSESAVLCEVSQLMNRCPAPSPNPYDIIGYVHACNDYKRIHRLVADILSNYSFYALHKNKIGKDDFDDTSILMAKDSYEENLKELRDFIEKRSAESWK